MKKSEKNKLIIELPTDCPEILKDDIQEVIKHVLILFQLLSEKFPPPAIEDTKKVFNQILTTLKSNE